MICSPLRNRLVIIFGAACFLGCTVAEATLWFSSPPFPNENGKGFTQDLLTEFGGESAVTVSKVWRRWRPVLPDEEGYVNLLDYFITTDDKVVYALGIFDTKTAGIGVWRFGSDDGIKVWVKGKLTYSLAARRRAGKDSNECLSRVAAGENTVLLKVDNGVGDWGFYFRLAEVFPQAEGKSACITSLTAPPYLLYGSQYPIDQWAIVRILNNGTEPLDGAVFQLRMDKAVIGQKVIAELGPLSWVKCRVRVEIPPPEGVEKHLTFGKATVLLAEKEIAAAESLAIPIRGVHPLLTGLRDDDGVLRFVHATDTHVIAEDTVLHDVKTGDNLKAAIRAINNNIKVPPDFVMVTGDLTLDSVPGLDYFAELMKPLGTPWLMIPGNHDKPGGEEATVRLFGRHGLPLYYSFDYAGYHIVGLDGQPPTGSPVAGGFITEEIEWLKRDLESAKGKETLVFVHQHPLMTRIGRRDDLVDWPELVAVLESFPQVKWVFCGHAHVDYFAKRLGIRYIMTTAVAYQFSPREVPYFANEAGVRLMEYKDGKVSSRFMRVDGTWRDDPSVEDCPEFSLREQ